MFGGAHGGTCASQAFNAKAYTGLSGPWRDLSGTPRSLCLYQVLIGLYRIGCESVPKASGPFLLAAKTDHSSSRGYVRAPSFVLDQVGGP